MQRITMLGMALLAAFAIVAVNAVSVSASGHEFIASKTGKTKSKQTNAQVFKTGAGTLECSEVSGTGEIKEGKSIDHKEVFTYSGCTAFGTSAKVTAAHFEFNANGPITLEKKITITLGNGECEVVIAPQTVEHASYENSEGGKLKATSTAFDIASKGTGYNCGADNTEGSYSGSVLAELEGGGTLEWK
jgi:hypothetical protein